MQHISRVLGDDSATHHAQASPMFNNPIKPDCSSVKDMALSHFQFGIKNPEVQVPCSERRAYANLTLSIMALCLHTGCQALWSLEKYHLQGPWGPQECQL